MMYRFVRFAGLFVWATVVSQAVIAAEVKVLSANVLTGCSTACSAILNAHPDIEYVTAGKSEIVRKPTSLTMLL